MSAAYKLFTIPVFHQGTNCFLFTCAATNDAAIIDPGGDANMIIAKVAEEKLNIKAIINTHGHSDHISANREMQEKYHAPLMIHQLDEPMLSRGTLSLAILTGGNSDGGTADRLLTEGDIITIGKLMLQVIHTPGHTPGGICLLTEDILFTGDTLFQTSIGRTDFPGGSYETLIQSLHKLSLLDDELTIYPGHGPASKLGYEKKYNPYLR
ncbi:MAG: MBL fold metallo-hydrolase, partial [Clostridiales bacterium]